MATNIRDGYMSPQVWVAKREQKVIEVLDRLVPARVEYAENIFAGEKYLENGTVKRDYALLTMVICEGNGNRFGLILVPIISLRFAESVSHRSMRAEATGRHISKEIATMVN